MAGYLILALLLQKQNETANEALAKVGLAIALGLIASPRATASTDPSPTGEPKL